VVADAPTNPTNQHQQGLRFYDDFKKRIPRAEIAQVVAIIRQATLDALQVRVRCCCGCDVLRAGMTCGTTVRRPAAVSAQATHQTGLSDVHVHVLLPRPPLCLLPCCHARS
jgi:hypothetical protein